MKVEERNGRFFVRWLMDPEAQVECEQRLESTDKAEAWKEARRFVGREGIVQNVPKYKAEWYHRNALRLKLKRCQTVS